MQIFAFDSHFGGFHGNHRCICGWWIGVNGKKSLLNISGHQVRDMEQMVSIKYFFVHLRDFLDRMAKKCPIMLIFFGGPIV